jgi:hypothetical protein
VLTRALRPELRLCDARLLRPLHESRLLLVLTSAHWLELRFCDARLLRPLHES